MSQPNSYTSSFKAFFIKIVLPCLLGVIVIGWLFQIVFEKEVILKSQICGAYKVNRIINETHPEEIPIFGSSRAEGCIIPDMLGGNYFNYGLEGTGSNVLLFFLREECKKKKNSPLIILNLDLHGYDYLLGDISNYLYNAGDFPVHKLLGKQYQVHFSLPIVKYYGQYENYLKYFLNDKLNLTKYTNKGASVEKDAVTKDRFAQLVAERNNTEVIFYNDSTLEKEYFSLFRNNPGRVFVIVVAPYHPSYFTKYANYPETLQFLDRLRAIKNVKVFNFAKEAYPDSLFANTTHLNYAGAIRFNKALKDSLSMLGH
jgi:hypothetical protein